MKQFKLDDAEGIKDYIESLDICNQFEEIIVELLSGRSIDDNRIRDVRIFIRSHGQFIHSSLTSRDAFDLIFEFSEYFEEEIKSLSASMLFVQKMFSLNKELVGFEIETKDFYDSVTVASDKDSYELRVFVRADQTPRAKIKTSFVVESSSIKSSHSLESQDVIGIDELSSVLEEFSQVKSSIMKGI